VGGGGRQSVWLSAVTPAVDVPKTAICSTQLDGKSMQAFQNAIKKYYWCVLNPPAEYAAMQSLALQ